MPAEQSRLLSSSPDPLALDYPLPTIKSISKLKEEAISTPTRRARSSLAPTPTKQSVQVLSPSKTAITTHIPGMGGNSPWKVRVLVEAEPDDGAPASSPKKRKPRAPKASATRTRTVSVPVDFGDQTITPSKPTRTVKTPRKVAGTPAKPRRTMKRPAVDDTPGGTPGPVAKSRRKDLTAPKLTTVRLEEGNDRDELADIGSPVRVVTSRSPTMDRQQHLSLIPAPAPMEGAEEPEQDEVVGPSHRKPTQSVSFRSAVEVAEDIDHQTTANPPRRNTSQSVSFQSAVEPPQRNPTHSVSFQSAMEDHSDDDGGLSIWEQLNQEPASPSDRATQSPFPEISPLRPSPLKAVPRRVTILARATNPSGPQVGENSRYQYSSPAQRFLGSAAGSATPPWERFSSVTPPLLNTPWHSRLEGNSTIMDRSTVSKIASPPSKPSNILSPQPGTQAMTPQSQDATNSPTSGSNDEQQTRSKLARSSIREPIQEEQDPESPQKDSAQATTQPTPASSVDKDVNGLAEETFHDSSSRSSSPHRTYEEIMQEAEKRNEELEASRLQEEIDREEELAAREEEYELSLNRSRNYENEETQVTLPHGNSTRGNATHAVITEDNLLSTDPPSNTNLYDSRQSARQSHATFLDTIPDLHPAQNSYTDFLPRLSVFQRKDPVSEEHEGDREEEVQVKQEEEEYEQGEEEEHGDHHQVRDDEEGNERNEERRGYTTEEEEDEYERREASREHASEEEQYGDHEEYSNYNGEEQDEEMDEEDREDDVEEETIEEYYNDMEEDMEEDIDEEIEEHFEVSHSRGRNHVDYQHRSLSSRYVESQRPTTMSRGHLSENQPPTASPRQQNLPQKPSMFSSPVYRHLLNKTLLSSSPASQQQPQTQEYLSSPAGVIRNKTLLSSSPHQGHTQRSAKPLQERPQNQSSSNLFTPLQPRVRAVLQSARNLLQNPFTPLRPATQQQTLPSSAASQQPGGQTLVSSPPRQYLQNKTLLSSSMHEESQDHTLIAGNGQATLSPITPGRRHRLYSNPPRWSDEHWDALNVLLLAIPKSKQIVHNRSKRIWFPRKVLDRKQSDGSPLWVRKILYKDLTVGETEAIEKFCGFTGWDIDAIEKRVVGIWAGTIRRVIRGELELARERYGYEDARRLVGV